MGFDGFGHGEGGGEGARGAYGQTLAARAAQRGVDHGNVVGHRDGAEGACAGTLAAAYAGRAAYLARHGAAVAARAGNSHAAPATAFGAKAYEVARALPGALAAARAGRGIDFWKTRGGVEAYGSEGAHLGAVAAAEAAPRAAACAHGHGVHHAARRGAVVAVALGARRTAAVAVQHGYGALAGNGVDAEDTRYGGHALGARHGAVYALQRPLGHAGCGEVAAAFHTAAAAVGTRQKARYGLDAGVFVDAEFLRRDVKHHGTRQAYEAQQRYGSNYK